MLNGNTPVWQLSVADLIDLFNNQSSKKEDDSQEKQKKQYLYGIAGIAQLFNCSTTTANRIKKSGVIDKAITQIGKKIIVDAELALQLIENQKERRAK